MINIVQTPSVTLYTGLSASATSMVVAPYPTDIQTGRKLLMADWGTTGYCTVDPKIFGVEEIISFTGITDNGNNTATLTGLTRNLIGEAPYTTAGTGKQHGSSASVVFGNNPQIYSQFLTTDQLDTDITLAANSDSKISSQKAIKTYIANVITAIAGVATNLLYGTVKLSVAAVVPSNPIAVGDNDTRVPTAGQAAALPGDNADIAVGAGNKYVTQTGLQKSVEKYAEDTSASSTAYVITLSPIPTSLVDGMVIYTKFVNANTTTTPTLNVNGLGAKTITKLNGVALAIGDIGANMHATLLYDGTNFVLLNPVVISPFASYIFADVPASPVTTSSSATAFTTSIAANTLSIGSIIKGTVLGLINNGTASTGTIAVTYGGNTIATYTFSTASNSSSVALEFELHVISNTTANIYYKNSASTSYVAGIITNASTIGNITSSQTLNITISVTNGVTSYYSSELLKIK